LLSLGLLASASVFAENLYRWVDDQGEVHFTPTLPPDRADKPYDIYSPSGILIQRVTDPVAEARRRQEAAAAAAAGRKKPKPLYTEEQKKAIGDRLLLLKYRSEDELTEAMNLEIDHLKYDERILVATQQSLMNSLAGQVHIAANRQRAGLPIEEKQQKEIAVLHRRLRNNLVEMGKIDERKQQIRDHFDKELQHYRELVAQYEESPAGD